MGGDRSARPPAGVEARRSQPPNRSSAAEISRPASGSSRPALRKSNRKNALARRFRAEVVRYAGPRRAFRTRAATALGPLFDFADNLREIEQSARGVRLFVRYSGPVSGVSPSAQSDLMGRPSRPIPREAVLSGDEAVAFEPLAGAGTKRAERCPSRSARSRRPTLTVAGPSSRSNGSGGASRSGGLPGGSGGTKGGTVGWPADQKRSVDASSGGASSVDASGASGWLYRAARRWFAA
jgi:hypothetical protein